MFFTAKAIKKSTFFLIYFITLVKAGDECINANINICMGLDSIPINKYRIDKVRRTDYFLDPSAKIDREDYPDFHALSMLQAKGLCSYGSETLHFTNITDIRYARSYQCYFSYQELKCNDDETKNTKAKKNKMPTICKRQCYEYYNSMVTFLNNNDLCPYEFLEDYAQPDDTFKARVEYTDKLREICDKAEDTDDCFLVERDRNKCGFINDDLALAYCNEHSDDDDCCTYFYRSHKEIYTKYDPTIPLLCGASVFFVYVIIGMFFSVQFIVDIKKEEKRISGRSENLFISSSSTVTSATGSMDALSQQSVPISVSTNDSNRTALNAFESPCSNLALIKNDAIAHHNSTAMNMYRFSNNSNSNRNSNNSNRNSNNSSRNSNNSGRNNDIINKHRKNKSSSIVYLNKYSSPILNTQSFGRNFRRKKRYSFSNNSANQDRKKKVITSSEAQQLFPRTASNFDDEKSSHSSSHLSSQLPCTPNSAYSNGNYRRQSDSSQSQTSTSMLNKKAIPRKCSIPQLPYSNYHPNSSQNQDIDSQSFDITNVKFGLAKMNSINSYRTTSESISSNGHSIDNNETISEPDEDKHYMNRYILTKRSASLHSSGVMNRSFSSMKIQQLQQHILKQQQQVLQQQQYLKQQQQQQLQQQQQQQQLQQQQLQQQPIPPPHQNYYISQTFQGQQPQTFQGQQPQTFQGQQPQTFQGQQPQTFQGQQPQPFQGQQPQPYQGQQLFNTAFSPLPSQLPSQLAVQQMNNPQTATPIPQQFNNAPFNSQQAIISPPLPQSSNSSPPLLPYRNKSLQSCSSSVKNIYHKPSLSQIPRKYSLPAHSNNVLSKSKISSYDSSDLSDYQEKEQPSSAVTSPTGVTLYDPNRLSESGNTRLNDQSTLIQDETEYPAEESVYEMSETESDIRTDDSTGAIISSPNHYETRKDVNGFPPTSILKKNSYGMSEGGIRRGGGEGGEKIKEYDNTNDYFSNIKNKRKPVKKRFFVTNGDVVPEDDDSDEDKRIGRDKEEENNKEEIEEDMDSKDITEKEYDTSFSQKKLVDYNKRFSPLSSSTSLSAISGQYNGVFEAIKSFYPNEYSKDLRVLPGMTFKVLEEIDPTDFWVYVENVETGEKGNIPINCLALKEV